MSGSGNKQQDHFDLLPFIAILLCVMGVLLLVTISMAALYMGQTTEQWIPEVTHDTSGPKPVLVEWDGKRATLQWGQERHIFVAKQVTVVLGERTVSRIDLDEKPETVGLDEAPIDQLFEWFKARKGEYYPLFAVRPSGYSSFPVLPSKAKEMGLDVGYEPVSQHQNVAIGSDMGPVGGPRRARGSTR